MRRGDKVARREPTLLTEPMMIALLRILSFALLALSLNAQDPGSAQETATARGAIKISRLELQLKPLKLEEIEAELGSWQDSLAENTRQLSALRLEMDDLTDPVAKKDGLARINQLQEQQLAITDRYGIVIEAARRKGAEVDSHEAYRRAVSGIDVDIFDPQAAWSGLASWARSPEGGIKVLLNLIRFVVVLFGAIFVSRIAGKIVRKAMSRVSTASALLRDFAVNSTRKIVLFVGVVVALSMLGIDIGPFLAAIGAAGFIIGFALQGTLSNFAAGIMIIVYRPYDVGDVVEVAGQSGKVDEMSLVATTLRKFDNQIVVIPNSSIWGDVITNSTGVKERRVDLVFGVGYDDDLQKVNDILVELANAHPKTLREPEVNVRVQSLGDSCVNFICRPWVKTDDYWDVYWDLQRSVKERFDREGISIPFPQQDVHVRQITSA